MFEFLLEWLTAFAQWYWGNVYVSFDAFFLALIFSGAIIVLTRKLASSHYDWMRRNGYANGDTLWSGVNWFPSEAPLARLANGMQLLGFFVLLSTVLVGLWGFVIAIALMFNPLTLNCDMGGGVD